MLQKSGLLLTVIVMTSNMVNVHEKEDNLKIMQIMDKIMQVLKCLPKFTYSKLIFPHLLQLG